MKNNIKLKYIINFLVIFIVLAIVLYYSLKDDYNAIINAIINANYIYIFIAILILIAYRLLSTLAHYYIIHANDEHVPFLRIFQINLIILFFHAVTPFAGGGQPMEVYYLHNENIKVTKATNITLQNFIVYQISLVGFGIFALLYNMYYNLFPSTHLIKKLVILGFVINFLVLFVTFILSFGTKITSFISKYGIKLLYKLKIIKDEEKTKQSFQEYLINFHDNALKLKNKKKYVALTIAINIIALLTLYSMPYVIAKGLSVNMHYMNAIIATAYIMIIGAFVPIPGGTGGIEYAFIFFYKYFVTGSVVNAIMLLWRFISYYLGIIFGAISLSLYRKKE